MSALGPAWCRDCGFPHDYDPRCWVDRINDALDKKVDRAELRR